MELLKGEFTVTFGVFSLLLPLEPGMKVVLLSAFLIFKNLSQGFPTKAPEHMLNLITMSSPIKSPH